MSITIENEEWRQFRMRKEYSIKEGKIVQSDPNEEPDLDLDWSDFVDERGEETLGTDNLLKYALTKLGVDLDAPDPCRLEFHVECGQMDVGPEEYPFVNDVTIYTRRGNGTMDRIWFEQDRDEFVEYGEEYANIYSEPVWRCMEDAFNYVPEELKREHEL